MAGRLRDKLLDRDVFYSLRGVQARIERWRQHYKTVQWVGRTVRGASVAPGSFPSITCRHALRRRFSERSWNVGCRIG